MSPTLLTLRRRVAGGSGETVTKTYTADLSTDFLNPERGWMTRGTGGTITNARDAKGNTDWDHNIGYTVIWTNSSASPWTGPGGNPFHLGNYANTNTLPQALLNDLAADFTRARQGGVKLKTRFFYDYVGQSVNVPQTRMLAHLEQVVDVLNDNSDVLAMVDVGFLGPWGEMAGNSEDRIAVTNRWLDLLKPWVSVATRFPRYVTEIYPNWNIPEEDGFVTRQSRLGGFIDCFVSNPQQGASYYNQTDRDIFEAVTRFTPFSGETCWPTVDFVDIYRGANGVAEMERIKLDLLYRHYYLGIITGNTSGGQNSGTNPNAWKQTGHYDEISRRMGYRLHLTSANLPASAPRGASRTLTLNLSNTGFGKVYNPRPIDLVLVGPQTRSIRLTGDARKLLPRGGQQRSIQLPFTIPVNIPPGTYALHLALPDPHGSISSDPRYHIRLANAGMWNSSNGRHDLDANVVIS